MKGLGMAESSANDLIPLLTAVAGGAGGTKFLDWFLNRRKSEADVQKSAAEENQILNRIVDDRIKIILDDDEKTIARLEKQIGRLQGYVGVLVAALRAAGIPVPVSDEMDTETSG